MIVIRRRRRVIAQLNGPSPRLVDVANLQPIVTKAMIKLRGYRKIHRDAVFVHPTPDIVELFTCPLQLAKSHEGLRQDRALKEISHLIFFENSRSEEHTSELQSRG